MEKLYKIYLVKNGERYFIDVFHTLDSAIISAKDLYECVRCSTFDKIDVIELSLYSDAKDTEDVITSFFTILPF